MTKTARRFHTVAIVNSVVSFRCTKPQWFYLSISYHLFDQNLWKCTRGNFLSSAWMAVWKNVWRRRKAVHMGVSDNFLRETKKKERFLAKMFNYRLIKTGHAICWLGCCPHLWGVPRDWLAMCEREPSPMASVICQPPNWNDEQSCHRLSMGHMEWWANEQTMSQTQGFSQANQPLTGPFSRGWSQRLTLCKERWRIRVIVTR